MCVVVHALWSVAHLSAFLLAQLLLLLLCRLRLVCMLRRALPLLLLAQKLFDAPSQCIRRLITLSLAFFLDLF
jgi:hypothetical protein